MAGSEQHHVRILLLWLTLSAQSAAAKTPIEPDLSSDSRQLEPAILPLALRWDGATNCRPETDLREHLRRLVGRDFVPAMDDPLIVTVKVTEGAAGYRAVLSTVSSHGDVTRVLETSNCDELAQATAIVISMWLADPSPAPQNQSSPSLSQSLARPESADRNVRRATFAGLVLTSQLRVERLKFTVQPRKASRLRAGLGPALFVGVFPETAWGINGQFEFSFGPAQVRALGVLLAPQSTYRSAPPLVGGRYNLAAGGFSVGHPFALSRDAAFVPSAFALLGWMGATGLGVSQPSLPNGAWGAAGVSTSFELKSGAAGLGLELATGLPFGRPRFLVDETLVFRPPPAFGMAQFTLSWGIW